MTGCVEALVGRLATTCQTVDEKRTWIVIDLGVLIVPTFYSLRYSKSFSKSAPRNWVFLMSRTGGANSADWDTLYTHVSDDSLKEHGATATWSLSESMLVKREIKRRGNGWRFARIQQTGRNQSGADYSISLCGFEIYGSVNSVVSGDLMAVSISSSAARLSSSSRSGSGSGAGIESSEKRRQRRLIQAQNKLVALQKHSKCSIFVVSTMYYLSVK